jgi:hypothetical protein
MCSARLLKTKRPKNFLVTRLIQAQEVAACECGRCICASSGVMGRLLVGAMCQVSHIKLPVLRSEDGGFRPCRFAILHERPARKFEKIVHGTKQVDRRLPFVCIIGLCAQLRAR